MSRNTQHEVVFKTLIVSFALALVSMTSRAQNFKPDTLSVHDLMKSAEVSRNPDSAILVYKRAYNISLRIKYKDGMASSLMSIGLRNIDKGEYELGVYFLNQAKAYYKNPSDIGLLGLCYNNIGLAKFCEGKYEEASANYYKALQAVKAASESDQKIIPLIYNNLVTVQVTLEQWEQAMTYLHEGEILARKDGQNKYLSMILGNQGYCYLKLNKLDSAIQCLKEGMEIGRKIKNANIQASSGSSLGDVFIQRKEYGKAISYLNEAINIAGNAGLEYPKIASTYSLGEAYYHLKRFKEAEEVLSDALRRAEEINMQDDRARGYNLLSQVYEAQGNYEGSAQTQKKIIALKDSLFSTEKAKAINLMEIKYKTAEKDKQLAQNKLELANQEKNLAKKNLWIGGILAGAVIIIILSIGFFRSLKHKQRLQAEQIVTMKQEQDIGILRAMMGGEEKERARIARELHDGIGGMLSAAIMRFISIRRKHQGMAVTPEFTEVMGIMTEMGHEIRKTAHNLMPEVLLKQGLPEAIKSFCDRIQGDELFIDVQIYGSFEGLSLDFKLGVYRIIQELIKNITQHAQATEALVQLMMEEKTLSITIEDNGIGFDTDVIKDGIGLHNLQSRVKNLNGSFTLDSEIGKGTTVEIEFGVEGEG